MTVMDPLARVLTKILLRSPEGLTVPKLRARLREQGRGATEAQIREALRRNPHPILSILMTIRTRFQ